MLCVGISGGFNFIHENVYKFGYGFSHDGAAALIEDGTVVAAIEEERLNRIKHSNKFPERALRFCLARRNVTARDVECFAFYLREDCCNNILSRSYLYHEHEQTNCLVNTRSLLQDRLQQTFDCDIPAEKISFVPHHMAHAASAFALSGFEDSLVLAVDGIGDFLSGIVVAGKPDGLEELRRFHMKKSLGAMYFSVTRLLGYTYFDEYKVMGLAPYGDPSHFRESLQALYDLRPNGDYELRLDGVASSLVNKIRPRRRGEPIEQEHKDLAASLQEALEDIVLHILRHYSKVTSYRNLSLAGGVAQNCTMNGRILYSGLFDQIFVQPASHDAGCALGAALIAPNGFVKSRKTQRLPDVYWGSDIGQDGTVAVELDKWRGLVQYERARDIAGYAAELLASGAVIAWVQGRSEFGPRALGNRSILADPRPPENKDRINKMIKKREAYRPFAPSILEEEVYEYFDVPPGTGSYSFMSFVVKVREDKRALLGAITHVDGTARLQTVRYDVNPRFWTLLKKFQELTEIPCLLNTSFNNNSEPIVDSIEDCIVTYLTTGLDYLIIGDFLVTKNIFDWNRSLRDLDIATPHSVQMFQHQGFNRAGQTVSHFELTNTYDEGFRYPISEPLYRLLARASEEPNLQLLLAQLSDSEDGMRALTGEVFQLWEQRLITLRPHAYIEAVDCILAAANGAGGLRKFNR